MRLVDADALKEQVESHVVSMSVCLSMDEHYGKATMREDCLTDIDNAPTVDAIPVVRCKDCMYFKPWRHDRGDDSRCEFWNTEMGAEDYCSQAIYLNNGRDDDGKAD